jgi:hypothetical protein
MVIQQTLLVQQWHIPEHVKRARTVSFQIDPYRTSMPMYTNYITQEARRFHRCQGLIPTVLDKTRSKGGIE